MVARGDAGTALPRLAIAAPASGHGKTTVATGLMSALARAGRSVSGHKVGPDYIDPGYHALATGRPGRNLDPHLVGEDRLVPLLRHGAQGADIAVIEGVMGLYDGQIGGDGFASTAHVAAVTRTPVVLVVDISHASRSIAAVIAGMASYDERVAIVGVILNKAGSTRHADEVVRALGQLEPQIPVLGVLHRDDGVVAPSRHLGLVPAAERTDAAAALDRLSECIAESVDLAAVVRLARSAGPLSQGTWTPETALAEATGPRHANPLPGGLASRPVVAMAGGRAFTFRYAETAELLAAAGCDVVDFDPTRDDRLPDDTAGIYLGGGFPEAHAHELADNQPMLRTLRSAVDAGIPTVAECAGMLYLCHTLDGLPMVGAVAAEARMSPRLTLGYRTVEAYGHNLLAQPGTAATGHEFHRTTVTSDGGSEAAAAWTVDGAGEGFAGRDLHASYVHTHWAGHPELAHRYVRRVARRARTGDHNRTYVARNGSQRARRHAAATATDTDATIAQQEQLPQGWQHHHGDAELDVGLDDFAVNVDRGARPAWLEDALTSSLSLSHDYPNASPAEDATAQRHGRSARDVLATAGAAEAFGLLARARRWQRPVVVHPQFTEPDAALTAAGHVVTHVHTDPPDFVLDPASVPDDADLVVVGNPTNPTGTLHPARELRRLIRPGRVLCVDEAFMDSVPDEAESLAATAVPGVLVVRSLTKLWAIPGIRAGYVLGDPELLDSMRRQQPPWSVSAPAVAALRACAGPAALADAAARTELVGHHRQVLVDGLRELGIPVTGRPVTPFVLVQAGARAHAQWRSAGYAVRRADTFPGLDATWVRIAVREPGATRAMLAALAPEARCR